MVTVSDIMDQDHDPGEADALTDSISQAQKILQDQSALAPSSTSPAKTLLPSPVANAVSFATRSTSFALRVGTTIGGYGLSAAKFTTLSSLELGRGILEGILHRAGKDVISGSRSDMGRADAETVLERSFESLHQTMNRIMFWTTTGFHVTGTAVSTASQVSQLFLSVLDQFFGSTDSSRAIASIITLVRREFQNPATGVQGEKVGVTDLVLGLCGLAYLQSWCRTMIQDESRTLGYEEIIWDIVVFNDGEPIGVHEESLYGVHTGNYANRSDQHGNDAVVEMIGRHGTTRKDSDDSDEPPERQLKEQVISSLPKEATISITTSTTVTKIITVEVKGTPSMPLVAPPGLDLVESEIIEPTGPVPGVDETPSYKIVYRLSRNKVRSTTAGGGGEGDNQSRVEVIEDEDTERTAVEDTEHEGIDDQAPPVPPKNHRLSSSSSSGFNEQVSPKGKSVKRRRSSSSSVGHTSNRTVSPKDRSSQPPPPPKKDSEHAANQKRVRRPLEEARPSYQNPTSSSQAAVKQPTKKPSTPENLSSKSNEKRSGFRNALKKGSVPTISNFLHRDSSSDSLASSNNKSKIPTKPPPRTSSKAIQSKSTVSQTKGSLVPRDSRSITPGDVPRPPQRGNPNYFSSRDLGDHNGGPGLHKDVARSGYISLQDRRRRNSIVSLTDTFSVQSYESRAPSPAYYRVEPSSHNHASNLRASNLHVDQGTHSMGHNRNKSNHSNHLYSPSIYTLKTTDSQTSLVPSSSFNARGAYGDSEAVDALRRTGSVNGLFPNFHLLRNITRYSRYASAAYGWNFLKFMGIRKEMPVLKALDETHRDVRSFAHHTGLPPASILLSSFVDPQGGSDSTGSTETGVPLVHTIALDEASKAVVLACRGTLGFEDVLVDMMCDYDDLAWRGRSYKVHKGIHASARRLLYGGDGRVLATLKEALEEFPDYGLVLCGHSLGGAVTALLGVMLAEPASSGLGGTTAAAAAFVTTSDHAQHGRRLLTSGEEAGQDSSTTTKAPYHHICLPPGRPIHVYAYGPPATMSPALQKATRGLVTSTVHGNDLVPYLSLGVLHDFQALALAFKSDNSEAKAEVRRRIWEGLQSGLADRWYNNNTDSNNSHRKNRGGDNSSRTNNDGVPDSGDSNNEEGGKNDEDEQEEDPEVLWAWAALKTLRASMMSNKLMPPGEVFTVETIPALRRDAFRLKKNKPGNDNDQETEPERGQHGYVGRPATRVVLKYVCDVEARFREVRFGASMLLDHSPGRYEDALRRLMVGVDGGSL